MSARLSLLVACLAIAGLAPSPAWADERERPKIVGLRVGFADHYKAGHWTPIELTLLGGSDPLIGQVELAMADGDGTPSKVVSPRPVQVLPGRQTKVLLYLKIGGQYGGFEKNYIR